jgi:hypothetical protein
VCKKKLPLPDGAEMARLIPSERALPLCAGLFRERRMQGPESETWGHVGRVRAPEFEHGAAGVKRDPV